MILQTSKIVSEQQEKLESVLVYVKKLKKDAKSSTFNTKKMSSKNAFNPAIGKPRSNS
jgi:hypothetical protein